MWYLAYLYIFITGLILSLIFTKLAGRIAPKLGFIDQPAERKFHTRPTPVFGGEAIFLSFWIIIFVNLAVLVFWPKIIPALIQRHLTGIHLKMLWLISILIGSGVIALLGLADDKWILQPKWKLLIQFIIAGFMVSMGIRIRIFLHFKILSYIISIIWIVGITNAFNLLDNMDGVSSGVAFISSFILWIIAVTLHEYFIAAILAVFMGSLIGFLFFNFPPAVIFMGDCGSMFIGFMLSIITILGTYYRPESPTLFPVVIPLLVLAVPLFDTISVIAIRIKHNAPIFRGDKNHFSHRLVRRGMGVRTAVMFLYLVTLGTGLPAVLLPTLSLTGAVIVFLQVLAVIAIIALLEYYDHY